MVTVAAPLTPQVRMYSRTIAIIGGFLILASGAGELYRQKPRSRSLQSTGQVFLGIYLICQVTGPGHAWDSQGCCAVGWGHNSLREEPWDSACSAPNCPWWEPQGGATSAITRQSPSPGKLKNNAKL